MPLAKFPPDTVTGLAVQLTEIAEFDEEEFLLLLPIAFDQQGSLAKTLPEW